MKTKISVVVFLVVASVFFSTITLDASVPNKVFLPIVVNSERLYLGTAFHPGFMMDKRYADKMQYFSWITPEVAGGYWWIIGSPTNPAYPPHGWADMDSTYQYSINSGKPLHSYPLRWWFPNSTVQPANIEAWITEVMLRYPLIIDWLVVNEGWAYDSCVQTIPDIEESYQIARSIRPDARLWYNGLLFTECEQQQAIRLVQLGLVDVIGIQMHHNLNTDLDLYLPLLSWLNDNNTQWAITELDVSIPLDTLYYLNRQAEAYRDVVNLYLEYDGDWIGTWGFSDAVSWLYAYYPLPFSREYQPKPAWFVLYNR